jgi:5,10-methylene-tetrahydrofolate dehydrogenase/methenyl tetrahydrofolate cyclohydrolase
VIYPRPKTKAVIVGASRTVGKSLSSFLILAGLEKVAAILGCRVEELVPWDELKQYV